MLYNKKLEQCFKVVGTDRQGRQYDVWPRKKAKRSSGKFIPGIDHIAPDITTAPPGSAQRIADLAVYYANDPSASAFTNDLAYDLVSVIDWLNRRGHLPRLADVFCEYERQEERESKDEKSNRATRSDGIC